MDTWFERAKCNLLRKSVERIDYLKAKEEWFVTGKMIDYKEDFGEEENTAICELCEHEELRWHFEIKNKINSEIMNVGSSCINKFDIVYFENGEKVESVERDKKLRKIIYDHNKDVERQSVLNPLRRLWEKDFKFRKYIEECANYYKEHGAFSPKKVKIILWRMKKNKIDFSKAIIKVRIRNQYERDEITMMKEWEYDNISKYLNDTQVEECKTLRSIKYNF